MTKKKCVAVLDVGNAKTVALALSTGQDGKPCIVGSGLSGTAGLHKGRIVEPQSLSVSIRSALRQAEKNAGCRVESVYCAMNATQVQVFVNRGTIALGSPNEQIHPEDVARAFEASKMLPLNSGQKIVHAIPQGVYVDGQLMSDAIGHCGSRLEVDTAIIVGAAEELTGMANIINNLGTAALQGWIYNGMAMAKTVLTPEEQQNGVLLIDIGAGTADITLFCHEQPYYAARLPVAGSYITGDLSIGLGINLEQAERIKVNHRIMNKEAVNISETWNTSNFSRQMIGDIIEARVQEIFTLIRQNLQRAGHQLPPYVVLAGGTARLAGIQKILIDQWDVAVRIADPPAISGMPVNFYSPAFTSVAALSIFISHVANQVKNQEPKRTGEIFARFSGLWKAFSGQ